jgi:glutamine amidotransferase
MKNVTIIDYGMGNIRSLYNAIKYIGYNPVFYSKEKKIKSNISILPGVGAFNQAMKLLNEKKISGDLVKFVNDKSNFLLGICLGMQLFFEKSSENSITSGLGIIRGQVKKISTSNKDILPNVGWFQTDIKQLNSFKYLTQFDKEKFYYVHSFVAKPDEIENEIATSKFNEETFCAMVTKNSNIIGTQFHPEKSSKIGLEFLNCLIKNSIN